MNPTVPASSLACPPGVLLSAGAGFGCAAPAAERSRWFQEQIAPHEPALRAYLRGRFPGLADIDDLVQETYARLFRAHANGELREVRPYLFATARNAAVDLLRRRQIVRFEALGENERVSVVADQPNAAEIVSQDQELALLDDAIQALPPRCRAVLTLRRFHGRSHREIARELGISEKTVEAHLGLALYRCREYLLARGVARTRIERSPR